jgi:hypothetical protein
MAYFTVILVLVGLAGWLYLYQASQVALYAHEIRQIQQDKEWLRREIIALRAQVAQYGALEHVMDVAQAKGYSLPSATDRTKLIILDVPVIEPTAAPVPGGSQAGPQTRSAPRSFWGELLDQFRAWMSPAEQGLGPERGKRLAWGMAWWHS